MRPSNHHKDLELYYKNYDHYVESKNKLYKFIYKIETDSQTQKINLWFPKGKGGGGIN